MSNRKIILDSLTVLSHNSPMAKNGRPKVEPERKRLTAHVLLSTHEKIVKKVNKSDNTVASVGKVIDQQFA